MRNGTIVQEGSPVEIYSSPQEAFVGEFVGKANRIKGVLVGKNKDVCTVKTAIGEFQGMAPGSSLKENDDVVLLIRPDIIKLHAHQSDFKTNTTEAEVRVVTFTGALTECVVSIGVVPFEVQVSGIANLEADQKVYLHFPPDLCRVLP